MPHKLPYHIAYVTSEDECGRARDLLQQGPGAKGWASGRFCVYPQEIILKFHERSHLTRLQILAHQHLISEKIDIHIGEVLADEEASLTGASFSLLGHVKLSDNKHSDFKARELKSVSLECSGVFLKLVLHRNHVNKFNLYNQVGVVGVNVLGNEIEDNNNSVSPDGDGGVVPGRGGGDVPLYHDLAFSMYVDGRVAASIRDLEERRRVAEADGRHQYCTRLCEAITHLRAAGELTQTHKKHQENTSKHHKNTRH
ncbi:centrosomal protein of 104 kDa-like [Portunus trituberculatus]|uniref:centrosomal protein of 104 kDa-like n=1 Tax=Portunus trituberculatus TaxID=210409 RepID=UPI001E1CC750|nr:centrosomal protein of 104 kDa-like [Portunus trituberculatus]